MSADDDVAAAWDAAGTYVRAEVAGIAPELARMLDRLAADTRPARDEDAR